MQSIRSLLIAAAILSMLLVAGCSVGTPKPHTFPMGERVELGHIIYVVFETQWMTQLGSGADAKIPRNRYLLVRVSAANSGVAETIVPSMTLLDDDGKEYTELTDAEGAPHWLGVLRQARPAEAAQGNVVFDAPPRHYKLRLTDENEQKIAFVDLPLSFEQPLPLNKENPEMPMTDPQKGQAPPTANR